MKKIISYSLWGDNPKYCVGAVKNAELRKRFYPDWISRFYVHKNVDKTYVDQLKSVEGTEVIIKTNKADWTGMFWRFEAISDNDVSIMICRDTDSRLSLRESSAVKEFEESGMVFHIMRDHPYHNAFVLGGMFGVKKGLIDDMKDLCDDFYQTDDYGTDYKFFNSIKNRIPAFLTMVHDEFRGGLNFPTERVGLEFVGEVYDENENYIEEHKTPLMNSLK
tara:strand:- start:59189 stop:59848 length:660 start_codon:yes stop_codon:yes gene_type:complete